MHYVIEFLRLICIELQVEVVAPRNVVSPIRQSGSCMQSSNFNIHCSSCSLSCTGGHYGQRISSDQPVLCGKRWQRRFTDLPHLGGGIVLSKDSEIISAQYSPSGWE